MIRLTLDLPDSLHKTLKSLAALNGDTMRNIAISAIERYTKKTIMAAQKEQINAFDVAQGLKLQFEKGQIAKSAFKEKFDKIVDYLSEDEANKILMPYLIKAVREIDKNKAKTYSLEEVMSELKSDD